MQGLTDDYIFQEAQPILHSLKQRDCSPALHWCDANRSRLKKHKSKLEFKLRTQVCHTVLRMSDSASLHIFFVFMMIVKRFEVQICCFDARKARP